MKVLIFAAVLAMVVGGQYDQEALNSFSPQRIQRVNFGVTMTKETVLDNTREKWLHSFYIPLPKPVTLHFNPPSCLQSEAFCPQIHEVHNHLRKLAEGVSNRYDLFLKDIDLKVRKFPVDIEEGRSMQLRGVLDPVGWLARALFGVSTEHDVQVLAEQIRMLKTEAAKLGEQAKNLIEHFSSFVNLTNARLANMHQEINLVHSGMQNLSVDMINLAKKGENNMVAIMKLLANHSAEAMKQIEDLNKLSQAIHDMVGGKMHPDIVSPQSLSTALVLIERKMNHDLPHFRLGSPYTDYYYRETCSEIFRLDDGLLVALYIPITTDGTLYDVYEIDTFPVLYQNGSMAATKITGLPTYLAVARDGKTYMEIMEESLEACPGSEVKTCGMPHAVHDIDTPSCVMGLYKNDRKMVMENCQFTYLPEGLVTNVFELEPGKIHITNGSNLEMHCLKKAPKQLDSCLQCVVKLPCECGLKVDNIWVPDRLTNCLVNHEPEQLHPVNLAMLMKMQKEVHDTFQGDKLLEAMMETYFPEVKVSHANLEQFQEANRKLQLQLDAVLANAAHAKQIITEALDPVLHDDKELDALADSKSMVMKIIQQSDPYFVGGALAFAIVCLVYNGSIIWRIRRHMREA